MTREEQKEQNKKREQSHPHPTPPVLNRTWPRGQGGFAIKSRLCQGKHSES